MCLCFVASRCLTEPLSSSGPVSFCRRLASSPWSAVSLRAAKLCFSFRVLVFFFCLDWVGDCYLRVGYADTVFLLLQFLPLKVFVLGGCEWFALSHAGIVVLFFSARKFDCAWAKKQTTKKPTTTKKEL